MAKADGPNQKPTLNPRKRKTEDTEKESLDSESILKGLETQETSLRELRTILFNNLLQLQAEENRLQSKNTDQ